MIILVEWYISTHKAVYKGNLIDKVDSGYGWSAYNNCSKVFRSMTDIGYTITDDNSLYYCCSNERCKGLNSSSFAFSRFPQLREVTSLNDGNVSDFIKLFPLFDTAFNRNGLISVAPFPIKYLRAKCPQKDLSISINERSEEDFNSDEEK